MVTYSYEQLRAMAERGELKPEQMVRDARFGPVRADAIPEVAPGFAARKRKILLAGIAGIAGVGLLAGALRAGDNARLRDLSWEDLRTAIFRRDNYTCTYCGHRGNSATLEVDHKPPLARGGTDDPANLTTACWECNRAKGTMTAGEFRWQKMWHG
jgi:hypothetical protein